MAADIIALTPMSGPHHPASRGIRMLILRAHKIGTPYYLTGLRQCVTELRRRNAV